MTPSAFWDFKIADAGMVLFTLMLVAVGICQARIASKQTAIVDRQTGIIKQQEDFAEKNAEDVRKSLIRQDRAYLYIDTLSLQLKRPEDQQAVPEYSAIATITFKNFGKTPALATLISVYWCKETDLQPPPLPQRDPRLGGEDFGITMLGEGEITPPANEGERMSEALVSDLRLGARKLFFIVHVEYGDTFGDMHQTSITFEASARLDYFKSVDGAQYNVRT